MSVVMEMNAAGEMLRAEFAPGVIRSAERMTYTNVNKVLEGDPEMGVRYASLAEDFQRMKELALALNRRRAARGSIDFDLPEPVIEFDETGRMQSILRSERNIAHRIIEEFMLAANEAVAQALERAAVASLHRVHEKPDPKRVLEFEELAHAFGYSLGVEDLSERRIAVRHGHVRRPGHAGAPGRGRLRPMTVAEAGALRRQPTRPFRPRRAGIHAFHFAHSPLSRPDCSSRAEMGHRAGNSPCVDARRAGRCSRTVSPDRA